MNLFQQLFNQLLTEEANIAGGTSSVFGTVASGNTGNQFPAQNDAAYAPGDSRTPKILGIKKKKKKSKSFIQRRNS